MNVKNKTDSGFSHATLPIVSIHCTHVISVLYTWRLWFLLHVISLHSLLWLPRYRHHCSLCRSCFAQ